MPGKTRFRLMTLAVLAALAVALSTVMPGVSADGGDGKAEPIPRSEGASGDNQAPPIPDKTALNYPNLGSHLDQLVASVETGHATAQGAASNSPVHSGESVAVTIYLIGNVDEVVSFLEDNGGDPRNVGEDYIEAYVPVTLLGALSEQPGVIRVREIVPPLSTQGTQRVAGNGPAAHLSAAWNQAGYSGQGIKVGIIDTGFEGFSSLMGTELPATVRARCYTDIGRFTANLADCENDEYHGTIVAESHMDIAPEVELYIGHPVSRGDLQAIAEWMIANGVSVINASINYFFDGPGDGTSPFSDSPLRTVDRAVAGGVVWVNAAGNNARKTWFSGSSPLDQDRDGNFEFGVGAEGNIMNLEAGDRIRVQLRWDGNWGGAATNLNLAMWNIDTRPFRLIAYSIDPQWGAPGHVPFEGLAYTAPVDGRYAVAVQHFSGSVPDWIQLTVWDVSSIRHYTGNGSIGNPGESANPGMLAVGAAHWNDVRAIEPYSSLGPTPDGRVKPDIVGADCGATALRPLDEYNEGFCGTSQAAPHVAGLAALVRQRFPDYSPSQVASYLKDNAEQRQSPDPNYTWGHGFAKLPPPEGTARPTPPALPDAFARNPAADFNGLVSAGNTGPLGIWSDRNTIWVADYKRGRIFAYDLDTKARVTRQDFHVLRAVGNPGPRGIWSDGTTMWVVDRMDERINAFDLATKARNSSQDFNTLKAAGNTLPQGIWSDGTTMWVADYVDEKIYAYDMATKARVSGSDFDTLIDAGNSEPLGIWSDGTTMWVVDDADEKIYAYDMTTKARVLGSDFNTLISAGNFAPYGIWSDGKTMWVSDFEGGKIFAYWMPPAAPDVVVESASVDDDNLATESPFALSVTVRNRGNDSSGTTTLRYYQSADSTITSDDTEVGTGPVSGLAPSESSPHSISLSTPSTAGTYYYGACVDAIQGEVETSNNCSEAVTVTVVAAPGAPTGLKATANGPTGIGLSWNAPAYNGGGAISGYRIEMSTDSSDWSDLVADTNSTGTNYSHTGLALGDTRHYRVSAINPAGTGAASNVASATTAQTPPGSAGAARSFSTSSVAPGGQVTVTINAANYGPIGEVTETLPQGFNYVSSSNPDAEEGDRTVKFYLLGDTSFTYTVTASSVEDSYSFSGTLTDIGGSEYVIGGVATVTVSSGGPLVAKYDADGNGTIDRNEAIAVLRRYLAGDANVPRAEAIAVLRLYLSGTG